MQAKWPGEVCWLQLYAIEALLEPVEAGVADAVTVVPVIPRAIAVVPMRTRTPLLP
jgi:hypothetical protein